MSEKDGSDLPEESPPSPDQPEALIRPMKYKYRQPSRIIREACDFCIQPVRNLS